MNHKVALFALVVVGLAIIRSPQYQSSGLNSTGSFQIGGQQLDLLDAGVITAIVLFGGDALGKNDPVKQN